MTRGERWPAACKGRHETLAQRLRIEGFFGNPHSPWQRSTNENTTGLMREYLIHANASRHSALSDGRAQKIKAQLKAEVQEMLKLAEAADQCNVPEGVDLSAEIERRAAWLAAIASAKARIEACARKRFTQ